MEGGMVINQKGIWWREGVFSYLSVHFLSLLTSIECLSPTPFKNVSQLARGFRCFRSTESSLGLYHHTVSIYQCH